jgi:hypothetical protein
MTTRSTDEKTTHPDGNGELFSESNESGERKSPARKQGGTEWTRNVLDAIIREAMAGSVKHQELFLKYKNHFDLPDGEDDPTETIYEAHFVDDTPEDPEAL